MHQKWEGLLHLLAGGLSAGLLWAVLRRREGRDHKREGAQDRGSPRSRTRKAGEKVSCVETKQNNVIGSGNVAAVDPGGRLYQVTQNELIVHQMLLAGDDEIQFRDFVSPPEAEAAIAGGGVDLEVSVVASAAQQVKVAAEAAFFSLLRDSLAQGGSPPQMERLAGLLLDTRDQLAELVPRSTPEGQALTAAIREKLDTEYMCQRLSHGYEPAYLSQLFDFLVHVIAQLQAPARRAGTQAKYAEVAAQFAAAAAASAAIAPGTAQAAAPAKAAVSPSAALQGTSPTAAAPVAGAAGAGPAPASRSEREVGAAPEEGRGSAGAAGEAPTEASKAEAARAQLERPAPGSPADAVERALDGQAAQQAQQEEQQEEAVSVQFVVRESVQSVRLIMRVVEAHWLERHGSAAIATCPSGPTTPSRPAGEPSTPGAMPPAGLGRTSSAVATAPEDAAAPMHRSGSGGGGGTFFGSGSQVPLAAAPHHYRGPSLARISGSGAGGGGSSGSAAGSFKNAGGGSAEPDSASVGSAASRAAAGAAAGRAGGSGRPLSDAELDALVAAARLMWEQLNELKSDVAKARLSLLKDAITSGGSGLEYERRRYERALAGRPASEAMPKAFAWMQEALAQARATPGLRGPELVRACVVSGILSLLQRPTALSPADCPETLLLDIRALVALQSELQRACLLVASCLIAQQVLAGRRIALGRGALQQLCVTSVSRIGVLLSSGVNLEGIAIELHHQIQQAAAGSSATQQQPQQPPARQEAAEGAGSGSSASGGGSGVVIEVEVVRRMVRRMFSTEDVVYRRVLAGVTAALSSLLMGGQAGRERCRQALRGLGGEAALDEVVQLGAGVDRIATLSAAVCLPFYSSMVAAAEAERRGAGSDAGLSNAGGGSGGGS